MGIVARWQRLRFDLAVSAAGLRTRAFWRGAFLVAAGIAAARIAVWELDLDGWRRDGLECLPVLLAVPAYAAGRRRLAAKLSMLRAANAVTDAAAAPEQSGPAAQGCAAEHGCWAKYTSGNAVGGWASSWPSRVSRWWREWRCRGSAT